MRQLQYKWIPRESLLRGLSDKSGFLTEVHLDIKYKVTIDIFISYRLFLTVIQDMKSNSNVGHFFLNSVTPKSVVIILVESVCFFDRGRYLHTKFVGILEKTRFDLSNYVISLLQSIGYTLIKCGFFRNIVPYNIFCNIYRF